MGSVGIKLLSSIIIYNSLGSVRGFHFNSKLRVLGSPALRSKSSFHPLTQRVLVRKMADTTDASKLIESSNGAKKHNFTWQQTMLRIKDPKLSLPFYENLFGFKLVHFYNFPQWNFSLYFLAFIPEEEPFDLVPGSAESEAWLWSCKSEHLCEHSKFFVSTLANTYF